MRLNNSGWGLKEMIFFAAIIMIAVIVVAILINNLYTTLDGNSGNISNTYNKVEKNLENAAKKYIKEYPEETLITSDELIDAGYLTLSKMSVNNDLCDGYVLVEESAVTPYITCTNYETDGY